MPAAVAQPQADADQAIAHKAQAAAAAIVTAATALTEALPHLRDHARSAPPSTAEVLAAGARDRLLSWEVGGSAGAATPAATSSQLPTHIDLAHRSPNGAQANTVENILADGCR